MKYRIVIKWIKTGEITIKYFNSFVEMDSFFAHLERVEDNGALIRYVAQGCKESCNPILYGFNCFGDMRRLLCRIEWVK